MFAEKTMWYICDFLGHRFDDELVYEPSSPDWKHGCGEDRNGFQEPLTPEKRKMVCHYSSFNISICRGLRPKELEMGVYIGKNLEITSRH